jgi:hypothetical protein
VHQIVNRANCWDIMTISSTNEWKASITKL